MMMGACKLSNWRASSSSSRAINFLEYITMSTSTASWFLHVHYLFHSLLRSADETQNWYKATNRTCEFKSIPAFRNSSTTRAAACLNSGFKNNFIACILFGIEPDETSIPAALSSAEECMGKEHGTT
jgi:hypothetical protein